MSITPNSIDLVIQGIELSERKKKLEADNLHKISEMLDAVKASHKRVLEAVDAIHELSSNHHGMEKRPSEDLPNLTKREVQVIAFLSEGKKKEEIAKHLDISPCTVATHTRHIFKKLRVSNASGAVGKAFRCGILSPDV
ncbi:MAG: helix-turn-helix transcriptional regulator [Akkermansiaceae bacterium]